MNDCRAHLETQVGEPAVRTEEMWSCSWGRSGTRNDTWLRNNDPGSRGACKAGRPPSQFQADACQMLRRVAAQSRALPND